MPLAHYPGVDAHILAVPSGRLFLSEHLGHLRRCFLMTPRPGLLRCPHDSNLLASTQPPPSSLPLPPTGKPPLKTPASWRTKPMNALPTRSLPIVFHIPSRVRDTMRSERQPCPPPAPQQFCSEHRAHADGEQ